MVGATSRSPSCVYPAAVNDGVRPCTHETVSPTAATVAAVGSIQNVLGRVRLQRSRSSASYGEGRVLDLVANSGY